jgi:hypothetical protein
MTRPFRVATGRGKPAGQDTDGTAATAKDDARSVWWSRTLVSGITTQNGRVRCWDRPGCQTADSPPVIRSMISADGSSEPSVARYSAALWPVSEDQYSIGW